MNRPFPMLIVPSLVMALALSAAGQDTKPKANPTLSPAQEKAATKPLEALADIGVVDVDFPGGTFGDFIEFVQSTAKPRPNIVASPAILESPVGRLSLKRLSVQSALKAAITASDEPNARHWIIDVDQGDGRDTMYRVTLDPRSGQFTPVRAQSIARALQVFPYREWVGSPDTILSAIENAVQMMRDREPPMISFHKESGLIFVSGTQAHSGMVQDVLQAMENRANSTKDAIDIATARQLIQSFGTRDATAAKELLKALQAKAAALDVAKIEAATSNAAHEAKLEAAEREREEIRRRSDMQMELVAKEIAELRHTCEKLRSEADSIRSERDRFRDELERVKASGATTAQPK